MCIASLSWQYIAKRRLSHQRDSLADLLYHRTTLQNTLQAWKVRTYNAKYHYSSMGDILVSQCTEKFQL